MMIHFRTRKYDSHIDSSYFLRDGAEIGDLSTFLVGDHVVISWPCDADKYNALENLDPRLLGSMLYCTTSWDETPRYDMHTTCLVAVRMHNLSRMGQVGDLKDFGITIVLEAVNGYIEDMLLWLMLGEQPVWAQS